jgi:hypothetical protein
VAARGVPAGDAWTYVPYDPSFETPDEGGVALTDQLPGFNLCASQAQRSAACRFQAGASSCSCSSGHSAAISVPRVTGPDLRLVHSVNRLRHLKASVSSPPVHVELAKPQMF